MIRINDREFNWIVSSGASGFGGRGYLWEQPLKWTGLYNDQLFLHITKTITFLENKGNFFWFTPWKTINLIRDKEGSIVGTTNAVGLTNPGVDRWIKKYGRKLDSKKLPVVCSVSAPNDAWMDEIVRRIVRSKVDILGIEVNASCPNVSCINTRDIIESVEKVIEEGIPTLLKLSVVNDYKRILKEVGSKICGVSINSVPWRVIYGETSEDSSLVRSPLEKYGGGGVSGRIAQKYTWPMVKEVAEMGVPVIAPRVWSVEDVRRVKELGASAISFGSLFLVKPWMPSKIAREWDRLEKEEWV